MSDFKNDAVTEKKSSKRSCRGGKNKAKKPAVSLEDEIITLLRSKDFNITSREDKKFSNRSRNGKHVNKIVPKIVKTIDEKFPKKSKVDTSGFTSPTRTPESCEESIEAVKFQERQARRLKKLKAKRLKKKILQEKKHTERSVENQSDAKKTEKDRPQKSQKKIDAFTRDATFLKYIDKKIMSRILSEQDPEKPMYVKGAIRINPKNSNNAFLNVDDNMDILISGIRDRNRALEMDVVVVMVDPEEQWFPHDDHQVQRTGKVVCILERVHSRNVIGTLEMFKGKPRLKSRDSRVPMIFVDPSSLPQNAQSDPREFANTIFLASIVTWSTPHHCKGKIEKVMGNIGDLKDETAALLLDNDLDVTPYSSKLLEGLPGVDYVLTARDLEGREDWRKECVFTIDPATAVDLDDAVSCKILPNGNYEIGVHISDVTHYLKAFSPLDEEVSKRATTVYLVNTAYHMLPKSLCQLCSLLPGQDKLSFSVIWEMTPEAQVVKHRFAKSVVRSCYQMAYEKAQEMIVEPTRRWTKADLPGLEGKYTGKDLCEAVNQLYKLSARMRKERFADGALSINQPKLQIILDRETGLPITYRLEERQDSNKLIEEFMLLANMTVARHLYETLPSTALLRIHGKPLKRVLDRTSEDLGRLGIHLCTESAGGLQSSLSTYERTALQGPDHEFVTACRMMVINALCAQSMPRANYMCSMSTKNLVGLRHYALNVPFYTHFTSPIRRYADCVVHRLLLASMTNSPLPADWSPQLCAKIASNCNGKKYSAKIAQEKSNELYFLNLLSRAGPTETMAIVMKVKESSLDVILCHVGINASISYCDIQKKAQIKYDNDHSIPTLKVTWKDTGSVQVINVFSLITLYIEKHPQKSFSVHAVLLPPRLNNAADTA